MLLKNFIFYFILYISLNLNGFYCAHILSYTKGLRLLKNATETLLESRMQPKCVYILCKFICFNGKSNEIDKDIDKVSEKNNITCPTILELRLYNYEFPESKLYSGFLGSYSNKVQKLYLASSNITDINTGSFANGIFQAIHLENLRLVELKRDFFKDISTDFEALSIVQKEEPLKVVNSNFLDYVKYKIRYLTIQVGLGCVRNLTEGDNLLNNLMYVDFSYNNFGSQLMESSFNKLSMVEHMDLSHSNIEYIPPYIFADFTKTLEYLDLSFNKLKTITRTIFGWHEIPRELKVYANDNEWLCSCELQKEMKAIIMYQFTKVVCFEPQEYINWSVFDERFCKINSVGGGAPVKGETTRQALDFTTTITNEMEEEASKHELPITDGPTDFANSTESAFTSTIPYEPKPDYAAKEDVINLVCLDGDNFRNHIKQALIRPLLEFNVIAVDNLSVNVVVKSSLNLNDSFGLIWFSKVTAEYYKMQINYNEYGLGCYRGITHVTTISDLIPGMAYTVCVVLKNQMTTSPFSCKSIHIGGNLSVQYSAWLSTDMKVTGLSLIIFGIVMFSFAGILMIYLLLKHKPILLKGSKRVTTTHGNNNDIVVLPKNSAQSMKQKEKKITTQSSASCSQGRHNSTESVASYQSYINSNLYEVIPNQIKSPSIASPNLQLQIPYTDMEYSDLECCYLTPLNAVSSSVEFINYAEIQYRAKRISSDPLPEVPTEQAPHALALSDKDEQSEYTDVGVFYMLDSQV